MIPSQAKPSHFTLIELLVVIAILGILVSILIPSLAKAKYKVKLSVCLATLSQNGAHLTKYAIANNNKYPAIKGRNDRWSLKNGSVYRTPFLKTVFETDNIDDNIVCALNPSPSLSDSSANRIYTSYDFYAGTYLTADSTTGMFFLSKDVTVDGNLITAVMGDALRTNRSGGNAHTPHPAEGLKHGIADNASYALGSYRGLYFKKLDRNFVFKDGHASTIRNISGSSTLNDDRFQEISNGPDRGASGSFRAWVPISK